MNGFQMKYTPEKTRAFIKKYLIFLCWFTIISCITEGHLFAKSDHDVNVSITTGFNNVFKLKTWTPLSVTLENTGPDISGKVEILVSSGNEYRQDIHTTRYSTQVSLPENSKKKYSFNVYIDSFLHPVIVLFKAGDLIVFSKELNIRDFYTEKELIVILDNRLSLDSLTALPDTYKTVLSNPKYLPDNWIGYTGVKTVFCPPHILRSLNNKQTEALTGWITRGGQLITSGGIEYSAYSDPAVKKIISVNISGISKINTLTSLKQFCGYTLSGKEPFILMNATVDNSMVILMEQDIPVIIKKEKQLGSIYILTLNLNHPSYSKWEGKSSFWKTLLSDTNSKGYAGTPIDKTDLAGVLVANMSQSFPDYSYFALLILVYYSVLHIVISRLLKKNKRLLKTTFILSFSILTSCICYQFYQVFFSAQVSESNSYHHFMKKGDTSYANTFHLFGFYTSGKDTQSFSFKDKSIPASPFFPSKDTPTEISNWEINQKNTGFFFNVDQNRWSGSFLTLTSAEKLPIQSTGESSNGTIVINIHNLSKYAVTHSFLLYKNIFYRTGTLKPDETLTMDLMSQKGIEPGSMFHNKDRIINLILSKQNTLKHSEIKKTLTDKMIVTLQKKYQNDGNHMVFGGWLDKNPITPDFENHPNTHEAVSFIEMLITVKDQDSHVYEI